MKPRTEKLYRLVLELTDPVEFFEQHLDQDIDFGGHVSKNVWCIFHDETNLPSLNITKQGKWFCHNPACGAKGANVIQFVEKAKGVSLHEAMKYLYSEYVQKLVPENVAEEYHVNLLHTPPVLKWLRKERGIKKSTVEKFKLGFDNRRLTIPVHNEFGFLVNIRRYDWTKNQHIKMLPYGSGFDAIRLYPHDQIWKERLVLCEGELDALLLIQEGVPAITVTGGVGSWRASWDPLFRGKTVRVCFDVNDAKDVGQVQARKRARDLAPFTREVRVVKLPLEGRGEDITDYLVRHGHGIDDFKALKGELVAAERQAAVDVEVNKQGETIYTVSLDQASHAQYSGKQVRMDCLVAGKDLAPFIVPRKVQVKCPGSPCTECPWAHENHQDWKDVDLLDDPTTVLDLIDTTKNKQHQIVRHACRIPDDCPAVVRTTEHQNVESVQLIPETDFNADGAAYVSRAAFHLGHGIGCNQSYKVQGVTTPDRRQYATHIITKATPAQTAVQSFVMTPELYKKLEVFQADDILSKLKEIYTHLSLNATRIFRRPDLHQAIDLVFHSPLQFSFNNELVHKGWLEALIIGDTRTGKGYVAEGLIRYYKLGEVASAENCSFAGLVGGMQQINKRWMITWGKIPLNDGRLVVLDEVSALTEDDIQRMSRVRSEGIAEITKIQTERTHARTRLVWLANARSGGQMNTHNSGIEAIQELIGRNEDIARFDYALAVASDEVPSYVINKAASKRIPSPYTKDACRNLILWVWSRKRDQVAFTSDATKAVLASARDLGKRYSASIPLVQTENIRIKLAKTAAAVAGRTFSHDQDGNRLLVTEPCVDAAVSFLHTCYTKPSMGYDAFSNAVLDRNTLKASKELDLLIDNLGGRAIDFVEGLLEQARMSLADIADYAGVDRDQAQHITGALVRQRALKKVGTTYTKKPAFIVYLRRRREHYKKNGLPKEGF